MHRLRLHDRVADRILIRLHRRLMFRARPPVTPVGEGVGGIRVEEEVGVVAATQAVVATINHLRLGGRSDLRIGPFSLDSDPNPGKRLQR